jgi:carboxyl-terminal processing protease
LRLKLSLVVALLSAAWLFGKGSSGSPQEQIRALRTQAELFEKQGDWEKACRAYEELIKLDRNLPNVKQKYRYCVRRLLQVYRHRDETYRKDVLSLKYAHALRLYEIVSFYLLETSLDKRKLDAGLLFRKGLDEFKSALADPLFCKVHLNGLRPEQTREFRAYLEKTFGPITILTRDQALEAVREVAMKSLTTFKLNATTTVMEFVCGACHAVDEYSFYLTPNQLKDLYETWTGEYVGVGIRLTMQDGR